MSPSSTSASSMVSKSSISTIATSAFVLANKDSLLDKVTRYLLAQSNEHHPYTFLNDVEQKTSISHLSHEYSGPEGGLWKCEVSVYCQNFGLISAVAEKTTKQRAIRSAASLLLREISLRQTHALTHGLPTPPPSPPLRQVISIKGQRKNLSRARKELLSIQQLALQNFYGLVESVYFCIDIEAFEKDRGENERITEIGLAYTHTITSDITCKHFVIREHLHLRNGLFVEDNRDHFDWGLSEELSKVDVTKRVDQIVREFVIQGGPVYLVGHSIKSDIAWLKEMGVDIEHFGVKVCDVGLAYQAREGVRQLVGLGNMLIAMKIEHRNMHNDGNDAYYSILVFLQMMWEALPGRWNYQAMSKLW